MVKINRHIFLGNATENDVGTAIDAVQLLPLIYLGSAEPSPISYIDVLLSGVSPLTLTDALADGLNYLKLFGGTELVPETYLDTVTLGGGTVQAPETYLDTVTLSGGTEQRNIPTEYTQVNYVTNTARTWLDTGVKFDFSKNYEIEIRVRGTSGSWYILQAREGPSASIYGISGSSTNNTIILAFNSSQVVATQVTRITGNIYYVKATINNGNLTLYIKDETAGTEETVTGTYTPTTGQSVNIGLFGNGTIGTGGLQSVETNSNVYFARVKEDGNYILNYVPCKQSTTAGFYDKASGTFKTTTDLSAGTDTVPTPDTLMDIVCNNGVLKASPNLFNKNLVPNENEYINRSTGVISTPSSGEFRHSDFTTIKENTQYYVGIINSAAGSAGLAFYDDTKTFISGISLNELANNNNIITSPADTKYIRFSFRTDEGYNTNWQNTVYLVEGNQPLAEFIPYGVVSDGTVETVTDSLGNTASAQMLLSVGDYKDTQEVISGSVTRNIGVKAFNGTESWGWVGAEGHAWRGTAYLSNFNGLNNSNAISTHFISSKMLLSGDSLYIRYLADNNITSLEAWKQWLASQYANGTPVIIVYPTSSATTETVTGQSLSKSPVTQTAGSISNLPIAITESSHTVPTPTQPLDIVSNNGVLKINTITSGKNAINTSDTEQGYISSTIGQEPSIRPSSASIVIKNAIKVSNGKKYKFSYYSDTAGNRESNIVNNNGIVTSKLALSCRAGLNEYIIEADADGYLWVTVQLGDFSVIKPTVYEIGQIYTDGTVEQVTDSLGNTANAEMLLSVGNYKDTQEVLGGNVTRNIGIKVFDGTENWVTSGTTFITDITDSKTGLSYQRLLYCTHYPALNNGTETFGVNLTAYISANYASLYLKGSGFSTSSELNTWLAQQYANGTPMILVYPTSSATTSSVSGQFLSKSPVTQTAGSIDNLPIAITESSHTVPTPETPVNIISNNGVLKINNNIVDNTITGQGTFVTPSPAGTTRIYKAFMKVVPGKYRIAVTGGFEFIAQWRDMEIPVAGMNYGNIDTWTTSGEYDLTNPDYYYGIAIRYPNDSTITPSDFNGTIALRPQFVNVDGTVETVEIDTTGDTATAEMLLKVGDYQDVQSILDGGVTRNVGIKVFDGTENWSTGSAANPNRYTLAAAFNDLADLTDNNIGYSNCYTVVSRSTSIQSSLQNNECGWNTTKVFCVRDDRIATLADWEQFLADQYNAGTPVIVVYPLATPTTESVTGQPLTVQQGTNIVTITQASIDNLTMELSYKQKV